MKSSFTQAGMQRKVPGEEVGTRLFSVSQLPEVQSPSPLQQPSTGLAPGAPIKHAHTFCPPPKQNVLPKHGEPPATVYIDKRETR